MKDNPRPEDGTYLFDMDRLKGEVTKHPPVCRFCRTDLPVGDIVAWCDHLLTHDLDPADREQITVAREQLIKFSQLPAGVREQAAWLWAQQEIAKDPRVFQNLMDHGIISKVRKNG